MISNVVALNGSASLTEEGKCAIASESASLQDEIIAAVLYSLLCLFEGYIVNLYYLGNMVLEFFLLARREIDGCNRLYLKFIPVVVMEIGIEKCGHAVAGELGGKNSNPHFFTLSCHILPWRFRRLILGCNWLVAFPVASPPRLPIAKRLFAIASAGD
jgi:hypothetical protein